MMWKIYAQIRYEYKPVGNWISTPRPNKGRPHNILHGSIDSAIPENPLVGANICGLSAIQADL